MQKMRMVLCTLVQRFVFRLSSDWDPKEYEAHYKDFFISNRPPLPVLIDSR